jgi:hypothetical protein
MEVFEMGGSTELLPCPFCGGRGELGFEAGQRGWKCIVCTECDCTTPVFASVARAEKAWNNRHRIAGQAELRAALTLCADQLAQIRAANDPDDADSYRADDREGCLDWTFAAAEEAEKAARAALQPLSQAGEESRG